MFSSASRQRRGIGEPPLVAGKGGLMKALYIDIKPERMLATRALARFSKNAFFGPLAPLREVEIPSPRLPGPAYVKIRNHLAGICGSALPFARPQGDLAIA